MMFDENLVELKRSQSLLNKNFEDVSYLYKYGANLLQSKFEDLKDSSKNILIISDRNQIALGICKSYFPGSIIKHEYSNQKFDLVISFFDLHYKSDPVSYTKQLKNSLSDKGIIIGVFVGGDSLIELRRIFMDLETKIGKKHYPRVIPFIRAKDYTGLLQKLGFKEVVVGIDKLEVEYKNMYKIMKDLSEMGESCSLNGREVYTISKKLYREILNYPSKVIENFSIIDFYAR